MIRKIRFIKRGQVAVARLGQVLFPRSPVIDSLVCTNHDLSRRFSFPSFQARHATHHTMRLIGIHEVIREALHFR